MAQREVRGDLSQGLCRRQGGLVWVESVFPVLQHQAPPSGIGEQNAGTGLLRVKRGGTTDMAPGQIVAYKRSWSDSLKGRGTQTVKTATRPLSVYSQSRERNNWERRLHDVDSIAYLRSKTVQPMGGSSIVRGNLLRNSNVQVNFIRNVWNMGWFDIIWAFNSRNYSRSDRPETNPTV